MVVSVRSTHDIHARLFPEPELRFKVKKEKIDAAFRSPEGGVIIQTVNLDSPSPKKSTASPSDSVMPLSKRAKIMDTPNLALDTDADDDDVIPQVGHAPDSMEQELERLTEEKYHVDNEK